MQDHESPAEEMAPYMNRISTHILDITFGKPASNVPVSLEREQRPGGWQLVKTAHTDRDGRCGQLLPGDELPAGMYRLVFDTTSYFASMNVAGLYPVIQVTFQVRSGESEFHIPLLLSAYGYTTYRGT
jgi:5-hydroxyisourate hydrolase